MMAGQQAPDGLPGTVWLGGDGCTYENALLVGLEVRERAAQALPTLARKDATRHLPATMSDALSLVHAREDAKKKNAANKSAKSKHKSLGAASHIGSENHFPGAIEGGGDASAFWMYLEDFFRDTTQEDIHDILPLLQPPRDDTAFSIIPTGSRAGVPTTTRKAPPSKTPATGRGGRLLENGGGSQGGGDFGTPGIAGTCSPSERRSRRIVSKQSRDMQRYFIDDDDAAIDDMVAEAQESKAEVAAAMAAASAAAMTVTYTSEGIPATRLWDVLSDGQLAQLALEMAQLATAAGLGKAGGTLDASEFNAAKEAASSKDHSVELRPEVRSRLIRWLEEYATALSEPLRCRVEIPILGLRRGGAGGEEHEEHDHVEEEEEHFGEEEDSEAGPASGRPSRQSGEQAAAAPTAPTAEDLPIGESEISLPSIKLIHPYTNLMLQTKVPPHVRQAAIDPLPHDPLLAGRTTPAVGLVGPGGTGTATPVGLASPAPSSLAGFDRPGSALNIADSHHSEMEDEDEEGMDGEGEDDGGDGGGRSSAGRQRGVSNYALLAGRKDPAKYAAAAEARKLSRAANEALIVQAAVYHPIAQAVAAAVAAGAPEGPAGSQWDIATRDPSLLAAAPQDELAAETLALQVELATVATGNRTRLVQAVEDMLEDLPRQRAAAEVRAREKAEVEDWVKGILEAKLKEQKTRREAAHREALVHAGAQKGPDGIHSPRPILGRHSVDVSPEGGLVEAPFLGPDELYDVLAVRREEDEAFCAVCGDGSSQEPNVILFCDRCDVAVHQWCYNVPEVPSNEWLCWPCQQYEEEQRALGVPQTKIRPMHMMPEDRRRLTGGARDAKCLLCPIKCGAFRRTTDGKHWVHQTCAMWHPETYLIQGIGPDVVEGISRVPTKRWTTPCDICGKADGAVINCKHPGTCQYAFHVLCARNCGLYLTVRKDFQNRPQYRIYCAVHSKQQQDKDAKAALVAFDGHQKAMTVAQEKAAREEHKRAALEAMAGLEEEMRRLNALRVNLESCRMLLDLCKRREKLKKQLAVATAAAQTERLQDPEAALEFVGRLQEMESMGLTPGQQLDTVFNSSFTAHAQAHPMPAMHIPLPGATSTLASGILAEGAGRQSRGSGFGKRLRGESPSPAPSSAIGRGEGDAGGFYAKRSRRGDPIMTPPVDMALPARSLSTRGGPPPPPAPPATVSVPAPPPPPPFAPVAATAASAPAAAPPAGTSEGPLVERKKVITSIEADYLNRKLPSGFRYVPVGEVPETAPTSAGDIAARTGAGGDGLDTGPRSTRAARVAARTNGETFAETPPGETFGGEGRIPRTRSKGGK